MKASQPAPSAEDENENFGNEHSADEDLGLPGSIIAAPRTIEISQKSNELADA